MVQEKTLKRRSKSLQAINAGEDVEKREPPYTVGGNANYKGTFHAKMGSIKDRNGIV